MVPKLPAVKWHFGIRWLLKPCPFFSGSFGSDDGWSRFTCGKLLTSVSSGTSNTSESSRCFSRERFLERIKGGSVDVEWDSFDVVKTGKFLALSRMCLNIVSSDMILQSWSSVSPADLPKVIQGRSGTLQGKIYKETVKIGMYTITYAIPSPNSSSRRLKLGLRWKTK